MKIAYNLALHGIGAHARLPVSFGVRQMLSITPQENLQ